MDWKKFTEKFLLGILPTLIDITVNILKSIFNKFVKWQYQIWGVPQKYQIYPLNHKIS